MKTNHSHLLTFERYYNFRCTNLNTMGAQRTLLSNTDSPIWPKPLQQAFVATKIESQSSGGWRADRALRLVASGPKI